MSNIATKIFLSEMDRKVPRLVKAVKLILYDNGMVHRDTSETSEMDEAFDRIVSAFGVDAMTVIEAAERELQKLSDDDMENLCVGGEDNHPPCSKQLDRVLNLAFEAE